MGVIKDKRSAIIGIAVGVGLAVLGGSVAVRAAVPTTSGTVRLCYITGGVLPTGAVRMVDPASASCTALETAVDVAKATPGDFVTNLVGSDFTGVSLAYRNFANADMHGSTFNQTSFRGSDFRSANLSGSTISSIIDMNGANLTSTNFNNVAWANGGATNIDLRQATLSGAQLGGATFESVNLSGYDFSNVGVFGATFGNASNLSGANFTNAYATNYLSLSGDNANFANANFSGAGHILTSVRFYQANVSGANFTNVRFEDSNLVTTDFSGATLTGATWSNTVCPDNTNSDSHGNTCSGHLVP